MHPQQHSSFLLIAVALLASACTSLYGPSHLSPIAAADSFARAAVESERRLGSTPLLPAAVAIPPLRVISRDSSLTVLGYGLADLLMTDLARSSRITVVERLRLDAILREQELAAGGHIDSATAARTGRLIRARTLILGDVREGDSGKLHISTRVVDAQEGTVGDGPASDASTVTILDAQKRLALALFERLGVTLSPREATALSDRPTQNLSALLAYSRGVRSQTLGDWRGAEREFRTAATLDVGFRQARQRAQEAHDAVESQSPGTGDGRLSSISDITFGVVNRPSAPVRSDVADPAFTAARRLATLIITVLIP